MHRIALAAILAAVTACVAQPYEIVGKSPERITIHWWADAGPVRDRVHRTAEGHCATFGGAAEQQSLTVLYDGDGGVVTYRCVMATASREIEVRPSPDE